MKDFFYELKHEITADYFTVEEATDLSFPMHMHRCFEIILLFEGSMRVRIEREEHEILPGDMILIKPNRLHSLETPTHSRHKLFRQRKIPSRAGKARLCLSSHHRRT